VSKLTTPGRWWDNNILPSMSHMVTSLICGSSFITSRKILSKCNCWHILSSLCNNLLLLSLVHRSEATNAVNLIPSKTSPLVLYDCAIFLCVQFSLSALEFISHRLISQSWPQHSVWKWQSKSCDLNLEAHKPLVEGVKVHVHTSVCNKNLCYRKKEIMKP
jgi:hypothetical protein